MPLQATSGAASYDAFGGGVPYIPQYIEEVFSTWLYTGNGSTQTITNGIDLAGKGGLVWIKDREVGAGHALFDTARGIYKLLQCNTTAAQLNDTSELTAFNSNGFSLSSSSTVNQPRRYASWTFRKQPKFFDVVTYTGNGVGSRSVSHSLGVIPGFIICKATSANSNWGVAYRKNGSMWTGLSLNTSAPEFGLPYSSGTSSTFGPAVVYDDSANGFNQNGVTYVAYLFAHDAGGFGLTGTDNVISCGSYTGNGSATGPVVSLGYEPQWLMVKNASGTGNWNIIDNMRGMTVGGTDAFLEANTADTEATADWVSPTATGFQITSTSSEVNTSASTYIYIAIRRGPMKVPTTGTSVFSPVARIGTDANATVTGGTGVTDFSIIKNRNSTPGWVWASRLTGTGYLSSNATTSEIAAGTTILQASPWDVMDGVKVGTTSPLTNAIGSAFINYLFDRAPGFFDVVCYTATGVAGTVAHNLRVPPEIIFVKDRDIGLNGFVVYCEHILAAFPARQYRSFVWLDVASDRDSGFWNNTSPTASVFSLGASSINTVGKNYIAYLFASCPGVSKVGSYTGNDTTQTINCGFTGGARFVMIKRTDGTGAWYVWDTARGIVAGNDPHLSLNTNAAQVTSNDTIDTDSTGFVVNQVAATNVNVNAAKYIFLAIA